MPTHTAKNLFTKNITSAEDCLALYDAMIGLKPGVDITWVLRAGIVFIVSAIDTYFHDKIKYGIGKAARGNMPDSLANFKIPISELESWEQAKRKGNIYRNWVVKYYSTKSLQSPIDIADALKIIGIQSYWDKIEPDKKKRQVLRSKFNKLISRRNKISHEGDRLTSRSSGKKLRDIDRENILHWIKFAKDLIIKTEKEFP